MNKEQLIEKNKMYWQKRAEQRLISSEQKALRFEKDLKKQFNLVYKRIEAEISQLYFKYASDTGLEYNEVIKLLNGKERKKFQKSLEFYIEKANDEGYSREFKNYLRGLSTKARIDRLEALKANIRYEVNSLYEKYFKENTQITFEDILNDTYYNTVFDIQSLVINVSFNRISPNTLQALLEYPYCGKNYSQLIWGHVENFSNKLETILTAGIIQGKSNQKMADDLMKATETEYKSAIRLVRTETNYISNQATLSAYNNCNVERYMFLATLDLRTSELCKDKDNKDYKLDEAVVGFNYPPLHPHCRSTTIPFFEDLEEFDNTKSLSYEEWYKKYVVNDSNMNIAEKAIKNKSADKKQYKKYKSILGSDAPKTFEDFQNTKYYNVEKYSEIKKSYSSKNRMLKKQKNNNDI